MENTVTTATATLSAHSKAHRITREDLELIPTPAGTRTWKPVPHYEILDVIEQMVENYGWKFAIPRVGNTEYDDNGDPKETVRFDLAVSGDNTKLFGVTQVIIPGVEDEEMGLALGFRNSHDKTLALKIAAGVNVFICDNLVVSGDVQVRRTHTSHINPWETIEQAFKQIPEASKALIYWLDGLRHAAVTRDQGVAVLADCVENKALAVSDFMPARASFLKAFDEENPEILHRGTAWSVYQAATEQYKNHGIHRNQDYSIPLNEVFRAHFLN